MGTFDAHLPLGGTAGSAAADTIRQAISNGRAESGWRLKEEGPDLGRTPSREVRRARAVLALQPEADATVAGGAA